MGTCLRSKIFLICTTVILFSICVLLTKGDKSVACQKCKCTVDKTYGGVLVQCSGLRLKQVPQKIPLRTTTLLLDDNSLTIVQTKAFIGLKRLQKLDISRNHLRQLDPDSFVGLYNLQMLNLESNHLLRNAKSFPRGVFKPLSKLLVLNVNNNREPGDLSGNTYPDSSLQHLTSLQELYIDGLPSDFGAGFSKLVHLRNLTLSGCKGYRDSCSIPVLKNSTFVHVPHLTLLNISNCRITDTESMTFSPLREIQILDVSWNPSLGFTNLSKAIFGLQGSPIQVLKMNYIYPWFGSCSHLTVNNVIYLRNTSLREMYIDGNGIIGLENGTFSVFPKSLEVLSAKNNRFDFGEYMVELDSMVSLQYLDISYLNRWKTLPMSSGKKKWNFHIPRTLQNFIISDCSFTGVIRTGFIANTSLTTFIANNNFLSSFLGPNNSCDGLEYIDFSHNLLEDINFGFTSSNNSLKYVNLSHNDLGKFFRADTHGVIFQWISNARTLDISSNNVGFLSSEMLKGLTEVHSLIIADNVLDKFDASLSHMTQLKYLDIGNNKIQMLPVSVQNDLDELQNVTLRLEGNPLSCTCHNLDFLRWMQRNKLNVINLMTTECLLTNETIVNLASLDTVVADLQNQCRPYATFLVISVSLLVLIIIIMCFAIGYRYRWRLRRLYYVGRRKQKQMLVDEDDFYTYDAFVSYADDDRDFVNNSMLPELEQKADMRLCIHHRDFIPGTVITSNIANAIHRSRKTLVIVSPSFLESDWCHFEYNMAQTERIFRRENIIVPVLYQPVQFRDMPNEMRALFAQYSYLQYEADAHDEDIFWQNIIDAINTPEENGN